MFGLVRKAPRIEDLPPIRQETDYRGFNIVLGEDKRLYIESQELDPGGKGYDSLIAAKHQIDLFWPIEREVTHA